ncbi:MAG: hypothetical protein LBT33_11075 [Spirochaetia bacterium]|jgi:hypothetical protein|nr:hypothetical protein [Spirochaetia bacterium]
MGFLDKYDGQTIRQAEESTGGFRQFPTGDNEARIIGVQEKTSQNGNNMLEITFGNDAGAEIRGYIVDGEWAAGKLKNLQTSFRIPFGERDTAKWIGARGVVVVKEGDPYNGKIYNQVSHYRSIKTPGGAAPTRPAAPPPPRQEAPAPAPGPAPDSGGDDWIPF